MITIIDAISSLVGGEISWTDEDDASSVRYLKGQKPPSDSEIDSEVIRLQAEYDAQEYARNRIYPAIGDQLDMLWHAIDTGDWTAAKVKTTDFYTKLKKVKDDNPKPS